MPFDWSTASDTPPATGAPRGFDWSTASDAPPPPQHGWAAREALGFGAAAGESFGDTMLGAQELVGHALHAAGFEGAGQWLIDDAQSGSKKLKSEAAPYRKDAPIAGIVGDIAGAAPVGEAAGLAGVGRIAEAGLAGAAGGLLQPTSGKGDFATEKLKQVGEGAAGGAVAGTLGKGLSSVIAPKLRPDAAALAAKGVRMTPGQMAGGIAKSAEDSLAGLPVAGTFIKGAQRESIESFNRAVIDDALAPIGAKLPKGIEAGRAAVDAAHDKVSDAYNALLPKTHLRADAQFDIDLVNLRSLAQLMPPEQARQFENIILHRVVGRLDPTNSMTGEMMKQVDSELGNFAASYRSSPDAAQRQLGDAVREAQNLLRQNLIRQNPHQAAELRSIDAAFARLVRVEGAAGNRATSGGVFTPGDLLAAIKRADKSARRANFSRGGALGQDFAESAQAVLPNKTPNSGTPERLMWAGLMSGAAYEDPRLALGIGAATAPYTDPALWLANRLARPAGPARSALAGGAEKAGAYTAADTQRILSELGLTP